ncbi:hypothetical protein GCM10027048_01010 [Hymenobacter coalescens]
MKASLFLALLGLGTSLLGSAPAPDKPAQTLQLSKSEKLDGTITLANRHTLLFIPDGASKNVRVVAVSPSGQTAWQATVERQQYKDSGLNLWKSLADKADVELSSRLYPLQVFSAGNTVYLYEVIRETDNKLGVEANQVLVQQIDAQGKVRRHTFAAPELSKKVERGVLGAYADEDALYLVTKLTNPREETEKYFLERYDPAGKKMQQQPLDLPQPYATKQEDVSYHDWVLAGRRAGKTYFYRALRGTSKKDNPNKVPVEYEFRLYNSAGRPAGQFTTDLHQKLDNTFVNYSGPMSHFPSQGHVARLVTKTSSSGRSTRSYTYDTYDVSTSGLGEIYLDPTSEDCFIAGEYGGRTYDPTGAQDIRGTFIYKVKADGTGSTLVKNAYPAEVKNDYKFLVSLYGDNRLAGLFVNPVTREMGLQFEQHNRNVVVTYDANLKLVSQQNLAYKEQATHLFWQIGDSYTSSGSFGASQMELPRQYVARAQDGYCQKLQGVMERSKPAAKAKPEDQPYYEYAPQPDGSVLVVRHYNKLGSPVYIYAL